MLAQSRRKTFWSWYFSNLLGWTVGIWVGVAIYFLIMLITLKLPRSADYPLGVLQQLFPLLLLIVCIGLAQWLKFKKWEIEFDVYKWIAANVKGTFIAAVIFVLLGAIVGEYQRPILDFLYGEHTQTAQTPFIFSFISVMLPLLGSIGTAVIVAIDILNWQFGKSKITEEE
jgi:hypothetical protein